MNCILNNHKIHSIHSFRVPRSNSGLPGARTQARSPPACSPRALAGPVVPARAGPPPPQPLKRGGRTAAARGRPQVLRSLREETRQLPKTRTARGAPAAARALTRCCHPVVRRETAACQPSALRGVPPAPGRPRPPAGPGRPQSSTRCGSGRSSGTQTGVHPTEVLPLRRLERHLSTVCSLRAAENLHSY